MARDDLFRRSFEAGTAFLDMTREKAEALVKDLVKAGEVRKGKAQRLIDDLLERSRKGTEELRHLVRKEIAEQVGALGLATKDDIARVEARLDGFTTPPSASATATTQAPAAPPLADASPTSSPQPTKAPPVKRASAGKAPAPKVAKLAKATKAAKAPKKAAASRTRPAGAAPDVVSATSDGPAGGPPPNGPSEE